MTSATPPARILIVDDDRHVRELVRRLLEQSGYVCATAENGFEARRLLTARPFELIVCDLQMPGESGLEIAQRHERERLEQMVEARTAELRTAVDELKRSEEETVRRLAAAVGARDHETAEHIERVGDFSALVAADAGMEPAHCELIRRSSTLHDVGKIGVPDEILLKPGPLSPAEILAMQRHAKIGYDILSGSDLA